MFILSQNCLKMESLTFLGVIGILREALKVFFKNGKVMASIAFCILFTQSILYLVFFFSIESAITDLTFEKHLILITTPNTPEFTNILTHIRKDIKIIFGVEIIYIILNCILFILSATATILATTIIHSEKEDDLSFKEIILRTAKSWKRPLVTWLYISIFGIVFILIFLVILFIVMKITDGNPKNFAISAIFLAVLASILYIYLSVTWTLAIVVSVAEQIRGFEALEKAAKIVKGMKRQGFLLNIVFTISAMILVQGVRLIVLSKSVALAIVIAVVIINISSLSKMYWLVAFTVFYYRCKETHGETVELPGIVSSDGYNKIPTSAPLIGDNIP